MKRKPSLVLSAAFASLMASTAMASDYPTQAITVIVPYGAGGGGDTVARRHLAFPAALDFGEF